MSADTHDCFVVEGKLALPYQYFAGKTGSRFLTSLRDDKRILGLRCERCRKVFVPPRETCQGCFEPIAGNWVEVAATGTVTGFTVVRYAEPHQPLAPPYVLALIKLDGADTALVHLVTGVSPEDVRTGMRVRAHWAAQPVATILAIDSFRPAEERS
ncbi:MAG: Zn-ribbon domain-containing OB-fold protein [Candidatus Schekmanbacteria bacterium]|nr:Zn-ribbon domain-containing OB-fold protein [Candidatus Schekmanbacteria bacterium]